MEGTLSAQIKSIVNPKSLVENFPKLLNMRRGIEPNPTTSRNKNRVPLNPMNTVLQPSVQHVFWGTGGSLLRRGLILVAIEFTSLLNS